jgi:hypothetical protein
MNRSSRRGDSRSAGFANRSAAAIAIAVIGRAASGKPYVPLERMGVPSDADTETYANANLTNTIMILEQHAAWSATADSR